MTKGLRALIRAYGWWAILEIWFVAIALAVLLASLLILEGSKDRTTLDQQGQVFIHNVGVRMMEYFQEPSPALCAAINNDIDTFNRSFSPPFPKLSRLQGC